MKTHIRKAEITDAPVIADFNVRMAMETEGRSLDPDLIDAGVVSVLRDANKGRYWLAETNDRIVGQIMVTYEWSDWRNGRFWWIQSVYVDEAYRRQGVFSALYRHVESLARQDPEACGLRLYFEKDNKRALETYLGLGMMLPGYQVMEIDFRKDQD